MFKVMNTKEIEQKVIVLKNRGLIENIDFRVIYFSNQAEIKLINTSIFKKI